MTTTAASRARCAQDSEKSGERAIPGGVVERRAVVVVVVVESGLELAELATLRVNGATCRAGMTEQRG
jgi:hypothetical protein